MTKRKKILLQAAVASAGLAFLGVGFNVVNLTASAPYETTFTAENVRVTTGARPSVPEDVLVQEPPTEELDSPRYRSRAEEPPGADGVMGEMDSLAYVEPPLPRTGSGLTRGEAMVRVEELHEQLREDLFPDERAALEFELGNLLAEHFPTAADKPAEYGEPKNGDSHMLADLDVNNIFNKVWGLFQALIVAWATLKFKQNKQESLSLTDSTMDRIDERLVKRYATKKTKVK